MKSKLLVLMISSVVLLSGCVTTVSNYGDIAKPILMGSMNTVDWLADNDESLLRQIVSHNEKVEQLGK
jgi:hypothetical protein